jgi:hypothetical protein
MNRRIVAIALVSILAACGGGGGGSSTLPAKTQSRGSLTVTLKVPAKSAQLRAHAKKSLQPLYESPSTMGFGVNLALAPSTPTNPQTPTFAFDLSTCTVSATVSCVQNSDGSRTYTVTTGTIPVGSYNVQIATWDAAPVSGSFAGANELSDGAATASISSTNTNLMGITLNGVPATVQAVPLAGQTHVIADNSGVGYDTIGNVQTQWVVTALDVDGNIIAGSGAPLISFNVPNNAFVVGATATSNVFSLTAALAESTQVSVGIGATGLGPSGVVSSPGSVAILPMQELWMTASATSLGSTDGIFGFQMMPNPTPAGSSQAIGPVYGPPSQNGGYVPDFATDVYTASGDSYGPIAQDDSGVLWVYDSTTNAIVSFTASNSSNALIPGSVSISTPGLDISALATDSNGFLYAIDESNNQLDVWKVVGATPSSTPTFTVNLTPLSPAAEGLAIVPNNAAYPASTRGVVVVADNNGFDFYTNASGGTPAFIINSPIGFNGYSAAFAPDGATMWGLTSTSSPRVDVYTVTPGPTLTQAGTTGAAHSEDGPMAVGIAQYGFAAQGDGGVYGQADQYLFSGGSVTSTATIGPASCCQGLYQGVVISP